MLRILVLPFIWATHPRLALVMLLGPLVRGGNWQSSAWDDYRHDFKEFYYNYLSGVYPWDAQ